jgi:prepilin-type N-terminal cleavage/methylation domain-containing protein
VELRDAACGVRLAVGAVVMTTRRPGFTLLELIVALAVLSLLLAAALPRISATLPSLAVDRAAWQLVSELELARVKAINRNARTRTILELEPGRYRVEAESEGRFESEGGLRALPGGVGFDPAGSTRVSGGRISITFQPRGHTTDNATIALRAGAAQRRVVVSGAGRVRVE